MQIRCYKCHMPFSISRETAIAALEEITREGGKHWNAHCPKCRRANKLSRKQLFQAAPGWKPTPKPQSESPAESEEAKEA